MIRLVVEGYCQDCLDFTPDVANPMTACGVDFDGEPKVLHTDTVVRCKYRKRCAGIKRYLERQLKGEVVDE